MDLDSSKVPLVRCWASGVEAQGRRRTGNGGGRPPAAASGPAAAAGCGNDQNHKLNSVKFPFDGPPSRMGKSGQVEWGNLNMPHTTCKSNGEISTCPIRRVKERRAN